MGKRITSTLFAVLLALSAACTQAQMKIPVDPNLYPANADAHKELSEALHKATAEHKRVILMFGFQRCPDCHVLNYHLHQPPAASILAANFYLLHVDVGHYDKNLDLVEQYGVPLNKGVPALVVLESDGTLLYTQKNGEFEAARGMDPAKFVEFLEKWKPAK